MDITWHGYSCFRITERGHTSVVTDPFHPSRDLTAWRMKADLVTLSHDRAGHQVNHIRDHKYVIAGPGEYEVGELFVTGIALHQHEAEKDILHENVAYHFEYPNGLNVLHLGALHQVPEQSIFEGLNQVNALLLPLEASLLAGNQLADLISVIEPNFVLPMRPKRLGDADYEAAAEGFLKVMGVNNAEALDALRMTPSNLPDGTQVIFLRPSHHSS